jgi:rare lipoprotein A
LRAPATGAVVFMIIAMSGCSASRGEPAAPAPGRPDVPWQEGIASWYGPGLNGRPTASGEVFDQDAMTAAHPELPFGTRVRVVNTQNGRDVIVRINDRGPFTGSRIIDLSRGAARVLDMIAAGTVQVRIYIIESTWPDLPTHARPARP